ncbi:uncharacterized protein LOC130772024 isoform X2 [Actinidia eriantha]|uniref:uncharacterized protein LOC130772024 isoform X2 n=1 Tax=Actinidia eriantha TaxID=165200 RepID=UPI00258838C0|nr:uncharacterized protein LOC130772024 isoform X2 [Actinidia eriantha]
MLAKQLFSTRLTRFRMSHLERFQRESIIIKELAIRLELMVAARILQDTAIGRSYASNTFSGSRRLRDAIVLGYQLQRVSGKDISVPDWYIHAQHELGFQTALLADETVEKSSPGKMI